MCHFKIIVNLVVVKEIYYYKYSAQSSVGLFVNKISKYLSPNYFVVLPLQYMFFTSIYKRQMALSMATILHVFLNKKKYMLAVGFHSVFFLRDIFYLNFSKLFKLIKYRKYNKQEI